MVYEIDKAYVVREKKTISIVKFPNEVVKLLGGGELVSFSYLCYSNPFLNSFIIT